MIQKQTWLNLSDSSSALWFKTFHLYNGFFRKKSYIGNYIKGSIRIEKPQLGFYKGFITKKIKKGYIRRSLILRSFWITNKLNLNFKFNSNTSLIIKKKNLVLASHILGPTSNKLNNKRLLLLFKNII